MYTVSLTQGPPHPRLETRVMDSGVRFVLQYAVNDDHDRSIVRLFIHSITANTMHIY
jgi:hypothetical protein